MLQHKQFQLLDAIKLNQPT